MIVINKTNFQTKSVDNISTVKSSLYAYLDNSVDLELYPVEYRKSLVLDADKYVYKNLEYDKCIGFEMMTEQEIVDYEAAKEAEAALKISDINRTKRNDLVILCSICDHPFFYKY